MDHRIERSDLPGRFAAAGVTELVVFDPLLVRPRIFRGPQRLRDTP
jgi:hypothetical protein